MNPILSWADIDNFIEEFHYWKTHGVSPSNILDISDHSVPSISNTVTNTTGTLHGAYQGPSSNEPISTRPPTSHYSKEVALNSRPGLPQRLHISTSVHNQTHHPDEITPRASTSRISYEENNALYDLILKATRSPADRNQFLSLRGAPAERALCAISEVMTNQLATTIRHTDSQLQVLDSSKVGGNTQPGERLELRRLLSKLSKASGIIPPGLFLNHVFCSDRETLQIGGYADIFRGSYRGQPVALKRLRVSMTMQQNRGYIEVSSLFCFVLFSESFFLRWPTAE